MKKSEFNEGMLEFIKASPTPFHAVLNMSKTLDEHGFRLLNESECWDVSTPGKYYVTRNASSIIVFTINDDVTKGFRMVGAHTDSPCLKIKPNPEIVKDSYFQLGVEVYGGVLLHTWFDRDLSIAGRVSYLDDNDELKTTLIDFEQAIASIPSLAIHLDRKANEEHTINKQQHLPPVVMRLPDDEDKGDGSKRFKSILQNQLHKQDKQLQIKEILDYELSFYDVQPPAVIGLEKDFISSARLDNLLSCYIGLQSMLDVDHSQNTLLVCNDHEEVGSVSSCGAQGTFLKSIIERFSQTPEGFARTINQSMMISADNAHGVHPNYADKHDANHGPIINRGPVIKMNANQRYATNSETSSVFKKICRELNVPFQSFVVRSDMACGSTIGPITASEIGVRTLDVGVPTFAMHSIRELAGTKDGYYLYQVFCRYYS